MNVIRTLNYKKNGKPVHFPFFLKHIEKNQDIMGLENDI